MITVAWLKVWMARPSFNTGTYLEVGSARIDISVTKHVV